MKRLFMITACIMLAYNYSYSQIDSLINSGKCITTARQLSDSGKYELAIKELERIDPRDTNYVYSRSEKAKAFIDNEQYKESIAVCEEGLKTRSSYRSSFYHSLGLNYQGLRMYDQAISSINEGLKEFPFDFNLMYRLGIIFYVQGEFDKAEDQFFKTLEFTPLHLGSHLYLSKIAMRRGNKVEGMFAMGIYLALNNQANSQLQVLENFVKNALSDEATIPLGSGVNPFFRLDAFLRAKISFEEGYDLKIPVDVGIVRQYQLLFDQLAGQSFSDDSPWVRFYLKIYQDLIKAGVQEPFLYHILQSTSIKEVKKWTDNNNKILEKFYEVINSSVKQFRGKHVLPEKWGYKNEVTFSFDDHSGLESIGDSDAAGKKTGKWYYFGDHSEIIAFGNYTQGKKSGWWHYFINGGSPSSDHNYETGENRFYNASGKVQEHYHLKDGEVDGKYELFYPCGALSEIRTYQNGKKNGPGKNFYSNGKLKTEFQFKDDNFHGDFTRWYGSGIKEYESRYVEGKFDGKYLSYFPNGKVKTEGNYKDGKAEGTWSYYFENGRLNEKGVYQGDSTVGVWSTYNERGLLTIKTTYGQSGDFDKTEEYFSDGTLYEVVRTKNKKIIGFTFSNKSGNEIASFANKQGTFKGKGYFPTGELKTEFEYKDGKRTGLWKFYTRYGTLESVTSYKNNLVDGPNEDYYESGVLKVKSSYVEGKLDGLYTEYYQNKNIMRTGWYKNGERQQFWRNYYVNGARESDKYFLNEELVGYELQFSEDNKLTERYDYHTDGTIKAFTRYAPDGKETVMDTTSNFRSIMSQKNHSGSISYYAEYTCGNREGETKMLLSNGKPFRKFNYQHGSLIGNYESFYPDGGADGMGKYVENNVSGVWKWNNADGIKYGEGRYLDGKRDSVWTYFHHNGTKSSYTSYLDGERNGDTQIFGLDDQLILVKKFHVGDLIAYKAMMKDGKMSEWIVFKGNETVTSYYANGQVATIEPYKNGIANGTRKKFYPTGQLYSADEFVDGDSQGDSFVYYENGKVMQKTSNKDDKENGVWEYYDVNGNLIKRLSYLVGSLHGPSEFFTNGKVTSKQNFFGGFPLD